MARGGRHGDKRRLDEFLDSTEDWGNAEGRALSADQMASECEMEESDKDDEEEDDSEQAGTAGARLSSPQAHAASDAGASSCGPTG